MARVIGIDLGTTNDDDSAIVNAVIAMSHSLDLKVVAEGVETEQQLNFLRKSDCDEIQGMYFCAPLAEEDFAEFVKRNWADTDSD